ncbi:MAG: D-alanyl-D-alanine carboxypeptidase [Lachnospiraceae bacterium]|nr:D-alanyl-D-alanine carboxypeptidase [Lachnospiraceae bacterium]
MRFFCFFCTATILLSGCSINKTNVSLPNAYNVYAQNDTFNNDLAYDYFAEDLCVTKNIDFGTDQTDSQVAQGAGVFNVTTKEVCYSQNLFGKLYPASTTKILTAYVILKHCDLNSVVTVSKKAVDQAHDSSVCGLAAGDNVTVKDLLYGLMLKSGNDAAEALAEHCSGSVEEFAKLMNEEALKLGATNSHFVNPSGLPHEDHYTTVYDMYLIFNEAIKMPKFVEIINAKMHQYAYTNTAGESLTKTFYNTNRYVNKEETAPNGITVIGGKTGTTYAAGFCLVLYSNNKDGDDIISIVFKADGKSNLYFLMNQILGRFAN